MFLSDIENPFYNIKKNDNKIIDNKIIDNKIIDKIEIKNIDLNKLINKKRKPIKI